LLGYRSFRNSTKTDEDSVRQQKQPFDVLAANVRNPEGFSMWAAARRWRP
jgi:hypothetical protein